jgi:hypothetical protein
MAKRGVSWHGVSWHGVSWHGVSWHGVSWHDVSWHGVTVVIDSKARYPLWPCHIITLLADRAYQLADGVHAPARHQCPSPVVRLS